MNFFLGAPKTTAWQASINEDLALLSFTSVLVAWRPAALTHDPDPLAEKALSLAAEKVELA